jgi:hypothetical protein
MPVFPMGLDRPLGSSTTDVFVTPAGPKKRLPPSLTLPLLNPLHAAHHPTANANSPSRTRTYDLAVNSRSLYQLSYRGIIPKKAKSSSSLTRGLHSIIVEEPNDFNNFVKISLPVPIGKLRQRWTCDESSGKLPRLRILRQPSLLPPERFGKPFGADAEAEP